MKIERVNSQLEKEISLILQNELNDPRFDSEFFTITSVDTTRDLQYAKVKISFMGSDNPDALIKTLNNASSFIRKLLFERIKIRSMPSLIFEQDRGIEHAAKIERILLSIKESD